VSLCQSLAAIKKKRKNENEIRPKQLKILFWPIKSLAQKINLPWPNAMLAARTPC